jgi:beta-lactamase regulating signal transducer with metallopeptidase domain
MNWNEVSYMSILQMSVSSAILILVIVVIRALAIHKLPKKTFVALWVVVLFRLLIPLSVPLPFSIYTVADKAIVYFIKTHDAQAIITNIPETGSIPKTSMDAIHALITPIAPDEQISPVLVVWVVGIIICALFFLVTHLRCRKEYKTALPLENGYVNEWLRRQKLKRSIQTRYSDRINAPMTYGIWKPVILFPKTTDWQDEARLRYILTHELTHIRRFDILLKWLLAAAVCVHWFNPLVWVMFVLVNRDIEMSCDETVVWAFGETVKSAYALTLIGLEETKSGFSPLCNNFAKNAIEERINAIMKIKKITLMGTLPAVALVATLSIGAFAAFAAPTLPENNTLGELSPPLAEPPADVLPNGSDGVMTEEFKEKQNSLPKQYKEYTEYNVDTSNDIIMPENSLLAVRHSDKDKFTEQEWNDILAKIEKGEIWWED